MLGQVTISCQYLHIRLPSSNMTNTLGKAASEYSIHGYKHVDTSRTTDSEWSNIENGIALQNKMLTYLKGLIII